MNNRARFVEDRTPNAMSYQGTWIDGKFHSFFDLINDNMPFEKLAPAFQKDFARIKYIFACDTIRVVLRPHPPGQNWGGFSFPRPTNKELAFIRFFDEQVRKAGLGIWPVIVLPEGYWWKHPDTYDTFYAKNNWMLHNNMLNFVSEFWSRLNYSRLTILGDFDPLIVYENHNNDEKIAHQEWGKRLNTAFKEQLEVIGSIDKPLKWIPKELEYLKSLYDGPYGLQLYLDWSLNPDIRAIIQSAYEIAGDDLVIEETGVFPGDQITDDGDLGRKYWSQIFQARNEICPKVPVGIWAWGSSTEYGWGWSMNNDEEIRPCWWQICEGSSGLMWDIQGNRAKVHASRLKSNFLVIPVDTKKSSLIFNERCSWNNHVKYGNLFWGTVKEPLEEIVLRENLWWMNRQNGTQEYFYNPNKFTHLWLSIDFNWKDPNLWAEIEVVS